MELLTTTQILVALVTTILIGIAKRVQVIPLIKGNKKTIRIVTGILVIAGTIGTKLQDGTLAGAEFMGILGAGIVSYIESYLIYKGVKF